MDRQQTIGNEGGIGRGGSDLKEKGFRRGDGVNMTPWIHPSIHAET
jgi:hypothetical protein